MSKKYNIIYADPPWEYSDKSKHRWGAERHYKTMSLKDIKNLDIDSIADDNCALFLWVTFPHLESWIELIKAWGFKYKTIWFNWVKLNKKSWTPFWGMWHYTRSNSEICLLAFKWKIKRINSDVHSVLLENIDKHSKKPDITREKIVRLFWDIPRIELFARNKTEWWDIWWNELDNNINL